MEFSKKLIADIRALLWVVTVRGFTQLDRLTAQLDSGEGVSYYTTKSGSRAALTEINFVKQYSKWDCTSRKWTF